MAARLFFRAEVAGLLSPVLGEEKAHDVVGQAAKELGFAGDEVDREQALRLLEKIAQQPGLVGITARFAKTRIHLKW